MRAEEYHAIPAMNASSIKDGRLSMKAMLLPREQKEGDGRYVVWDAHTYRRP